MTIELVNLWQALRPAHIQPSHCLLWRLAFMQVSEHGAAPEEVTGFMEMATVDTTVLGILVESESDDGEPHFVHPTCEDVEWWTAMATLIDAAAARHAGDEDRERAKLDQAETLLRHEALRWGHELYSEDGDEERLPSTRREPMCRAVTSVLQRLTDPSTTGGLELPDDTAERCTVELLMAMAQITPETLRSGDLDRDAWSRLTHAASRLGSMPLLVETRRD